MPRELVPLDEIAFRQAKLFAEAIKLPTTAQTSKQSRRLQEIQYQLDEKLLRPDLITRVLTGGQSRYTPLCAGHKFLNASPVHSIFMLFQLEVGSRMNSVFHAGRDVVGGDLWDSKILNLRSLHGLWLSADVLGKTFEDSLEIESDVLSQDHYYRKWRFESSACEACMIGQIINDPKTLFDLWALSRSRVSRNKRKPKIPRLLTWLEIWVDLCNSQLRYRGQDDKAEKLVDRAGTLTDQLYAVRKDIRRFRPGNRSRKRRSTESIKGHPKANIEIEGPSSNNTRTDRAKHECKNDPPKQFSYSRDPADGDAVSDLSDVDECEEQDHSHSRDEPCSLYASLISTPFLPGMDAEKHRKAEDVLTKAVLTESDRSDNSIEQPGLMSASSKSTVPSPTKIQRRPDSVETRKHSSTEQSFYKAKAYRSSRIPRDDETTVPTNTVPLQSKDRKSARESAVSRWTDISVIPSETEESFCGDAHDPKPSTSAYPGMTETAKLGRIKEESSSASRDRHHSPRCKNHEKRSASTYNIEDWASGVSEATSTSRKASVGQKALSTQKAGNSKLSEHRQTHLLDEEDPEQILSQSRPGQTTNLVSARLSRSFDQPSMVATAEKVVDEDVLPYTFEDLLKEDRFMNNDHRMSSANAAETILLPLRYEPGHQDRNQVFATPTASTQQKARGSAAPLTNIRHALRPFSSESQETTWAGMYKDLAHSAKNNKNSTRRRSSHTHSRHGDEVHGSWRHHLKRIPEE